MYFNQNISKDRVIIKEGMVCLQRIRKPYKVCILLPYMYVYDTGQRKLLKVGGRGT